jgi:hypothetical protein
MKPNQATKSVGIDLSLKECAVTSDKQRKDAMHKFSTMLTQEYGAIFVGNQKLDLFRLWIGQ